MSNAEAITAWMDVALEEARAAAAEGEVPVGAVVIVDNHSVVCARNKIEQLHDATAHAEIVAIQETSRLLQRRRLTGCQMIVTLEPCPMCAMALVLARFDAVHFGVRDPKFGGIVSVMHVLDERQLNHRVAWTEGTRAQECAELLQQFFRERRLARRIEKK